MAEKLATLGPGKLTFGEAGAAQEFGADITKAELAPEFDTEDPVYFLDGSQDDGEDTETAALSGEFRQDYGSINSLLVWCKRNSGKRMKFEYIPRKDGAIAIKGECRIRSVKTGGDVKTKNTAEFEFPVFEWDFTEHAPEAG